MVSLSNHERIEIDIAIVRSYRPGHFSCSQYAAAEPFGKLKTGLSKEACPIRSWFDRLTMSGLRLTLQSTGAIAQVL